MVELGLEPQSVPKKLREIDHFQRGNSDTIPALLGPALTVPKAGQLAPPPPGDSGAEVGSVQEGGQTTPPNCSSTLDKAFGQDGGAVSWAALLGFRDRCWLQTGLISIALMPGGPGVPMHSSCRVWASSGGVLVKL